MIVAWCAVVAVERVRSSQLSDIVFESRANKIAWQVGCGNGEERQRRFKDSGRVLPEQRE